MSIQWDPVKMATGVAEVDAQHQEWIRRFNDFDEAVTQGKGIEAVGGTLTFFSAYAETHFYLEEARMSEKHCPAAEANRADHEQMRVLLAGMRDFMNTRGISIVDVDMLRMRMEDWLVRHIMTIDVQLRDC